MRLDHPVGDGEAKSVAQSSLCRLGAEEWLENEPKVRGPYTGPLVGNHNPDLALQRIIFAKDMDLTTARCISSGVAHHVFERTVQQLGIAGNSGG